MNGYHLYCGGSANKRGKRSKVDLFLKVDVSLALIYALPDVLVPDVILTTFAGVRIS